MTFQVPPKKKNRREICQLHSYRQLQLFKEQHVRVLDLISILQLILTYLLNA